MLNQRFRYYSLSPSLLPNPLFLCSLQVYFYKSVKVTQRVTDSHVLMWFFHFVRTCLPTTALQCSTNSSSSSSIVQRVGNASHSVFFQRTMTHPSCVLTPTVSKTHGPSSARASMGTRSEMGHTDLPTRLHGNHTVI